MTLEPLLDGIEDAAADPLLQDPDRELTLLNAVFLGALVVLILLLAGDAFDTLVVVVLEGATLGGVGALWKKEEKISWNPVDGIAV